MIHKPLPDNQAGVTGEECAEATRGEGAAGGATCGPRGKREREAERQQGKGEKRTWESVPLTTWWISAEAAANQWPRRCSICTGAPQCCSHHWSRSGTVANAETGAICRNAVTTGRGNSRGGTRQKRAGAAIATATGVGVAYQRCSGRTPPEV